MGIRSILKDIWTALAEAQGSFSPAPEVKGFLKNLFKEAHHPLNPSPDVMKVLQEKGYKFTFNPLSGKGFIEKNYTITTPQGTPIGIGYIPVNKLAVARYNLDYVQAVKKCAQNRPPDLSP